MDLSHDEATYLIEAIDARLTVLQTLPPSEWRDYRIRALEGIIQKITFKTPSGPFVQSVGGPSPVAYPSAAQESPTFRAQDRIPGRCPYCGGEIRLGERFCLTCGNALSPASPPFSVPQPREQAASPSLAQLVVTREDNGRSQEYTLDTAQVTVGRSSDNTIVLPQDKMASRYHATISYENGNYVLRDNGSSNGTRVNGQELPKDTIYTLQPGDVVSIGSYTLTFRRS